MKDALSFLIYEAVSTFVVLLLVLAFAFGPKTRR